MAGENNEERVKVTGEGRENNRHNFSLDEIEASLKKGGVQRLLSLIRFRNEYDAFNEEFPVLESADDEVRLSWKKDDVHCTLFINLKTNKSVIDYVDEDGNAAQY